MRSSKSFSFYRFFFCLFVFFLARVAFSLVNLRNVRQLTASGVNTNASTWLLLSDLFRTYLSMSGAFGQFFIGVVYILCSSSLKLLCSLSLKTPALKLGTWNVRTTTPGFSGDLQEVNDARKTAVIDRELSRLQMDIVALQETRLPETGSVRERDFTPFWQGKPSDGDREHGVGFAVRNRLWVPLLHQQKEQSESCLSGLQTSSRPISLISAYAPTLASTAEVKDKFYDDLSTAIRRIPDRDLLITAGDFNVRVGVDHNSWPNCLGQFGTGKMNENGQRLLELCCHHGLCISNTFFNTKPQHRVSWRHPRSKHWHQLDLILTFPTSRSLAATRAPIVTLTTLWCVAMWRSAQRVSTVRERRADLASTPGKHAIKEKWRSLRVWWRILSLAQPLQMPKTDGNTSEILKLNIRWWLP